MVKVCVSAWSLWAEIGKGTAEGHEELAHEENHQEYVT